jgi:hypothetical protein
LFFIVLYYILFCLAFLFPRATGPLVSPVRAVSE